MNKRTAIALVSFLLVIVIGAFIFFKALIISNPVIEKSQVIEIVVTKISEGGVKDIVFTEVNGDSYYINRGLEQGYTLEQMKEKVLNKKVTLHLAKTILGVSNHISQLTIDGDVIFTEFN